MFGEPSIPSIKSLLRSPALAIDQPNLAPGLLLPRNPGSSFLLLVENVSDRLPSYRSNTVFIST